MSLCVGCDTPLPLEIGRPGKPRKWCSERCRKQTLYAGTCERCGGKTNGSDGRAAAATVCMDCLRWTRAGVLLAVEEWADAHGGVPPTSTDWRDAASDGFPPATTVKRLFGGWNAMLLDAGFELRRDRRPETQEAIMAALAAGESTRSIADRFGVTPSAIHMRLRYRGLSMADVR
jgi:hypothetical protein